MIGTVPSVALALALIVFFVIGGSMGYALRRALDKRQGKKHQNEAALQPQTAQRSAATAEMPASLSEAATPENLQPAQEGASAERDNLRMIKGLGPRAEALLHGFGIYSFGQIAQWDDSAISWIEGKLGVKGRVERENWVEQARQLRTSKQ